MPDSENVALATDAITPPGFSCTHCVMHSEPSTSGPMSPVVQSNSSPQIAPSHSNTVEPPISLARAIVDVHDHGPPGLSGSRYILNGSFRI